MNEFKTYHPIVNFLYFFCVIGLTMVLMHPVTLGISLVSAISYVFILKGKKAAFLGIGSAFIAMLLISVINPLFNHAGMTTITYLPSGNPLTAESFYYGISAGAMLTAVLLYFSCYNAVMTSDKFIYLFGKLIPALSLVISMTLRFIPNFISRLREITKIQKTLGRDVTQGSLKKRFMCAIKIMSILITWSLESTIETADSMKSRGYGLSGRTAYSIFCFDRRDLKAVLWILCFVIVTICAFGFGVLHYSYFPSFKTEELTTLSLAMHTSYLLLCMTPIIIELREAYRWKAIK